MLRAQIENRLNRTWYGGQAPGILLRALSHAYSLVSERRAQRATRAPDLEGRPIVVVGNITVGGTGKTPLVVRLCELLQAAGLRPCVVSRGYGRSGRGLIEVRAGDSVASSGDEPRLIADRTGLPVLVGPDRCVATREAFARGAQVVISDDGLQRADFPRSYEICVIDGRRGLGNGRLLPAGPLREPPARLNRVDAVVMNGPGTLETLEQATVSMTLKALDPTRLGDGQSMRLEHWVENSQTAPLAAVAGIGNPDRFFALLERLGLAFESRAFPDHHTYTAADFEGLAEHRVVMTEKDAVKCDKLPLADAWYLPVSARLPEGWEAGFVQTVARQVREWTAA